MTVTMQFESLRGLVDQLTALERHAVCLEQLVEALRTDLSTAQIRARELEIDRDAAVRRAEAEAAKRLEWSRTARIWEAEVRSQVDEVDRLTAALRALTEVGEPPEGWRADADGDLSKAGMYEISASSTGPNPKRIRYFDLDDRVEIPAAPLRHWFDLERARQAQAQAALDATNTGDDEPRFPAIGCEGECAFHRVGVAMKCSECSRYIGPDSPQFGALVAYDRKMRSAAEPEVDPRTVVTDRDRENGTPRVCKLCGFARGEHNGHGACPNPGTKAGGWYDPKAYWSTTSRYEPDPRITDPAAMEAALTEAAARRQRVRIEWHPDSAKDTGLPDDHERWGLTAGVPRKMPPTDHERWGLTAGAPRKMPPTDDCPDGGWVVGPVGWVFGVGESQGLCPGIIAVEILGDADTESEAAQ